MSLAEKAKTSLMTFENKNVVEVRNLLMSWHNQVEMMIPDKQSLEAKTLIAVVANMIITDPKKFLSVSPYSVASAMLACAQSGLNPTPDFKLCAFVPYKGSLRFQIEYRGALKLIRNSGNVKWVEAFEFYTNDLIDYEHGSNAFLKFKPEKPPKPRGEMIGAYAFVRYKSGGEEFVVLSKDDVLKHKKKSPAGKSESSPWNDPDFEFTMWRKSALWELSRNADFDLKTRQVIEAEKDIEIEKSPDQIVNDFRANNSIDAEFKVTNGNKKSWPELVEAYFSADLPKECYEQITKAGFNLQTQAPVLKNIYLEKESVLRPILEKYL